MTTLAVIGTFYGRHERTEALVRMVMESSRPPDEFWVMCESDEDARYVPRMWKAMHVQVLPTIMRDGKYAEIPYSRKINWALDRSHADLVCYLDNGSTPHRDKYRVMAEALEQHPTWGAVYCGQHRTGHLDTRVEANGIVEDAYCVLNYTQVMHRRTEDRWTLDMQYAVPMDLADALFWRDLHKSLGPFHPVGDGILDEHHIESAKAVGL